MLHIAVGVFLGILAAVTVLNWWAARAAARAERIRTAEIRRGMEMLHPELRVARLKSEAEKAQQQMEFDARTVVWGAVLVALVLGGAISYESMSGKTVQTTASAQHYSFSVDDCVFLRHTGASVSDDECPRTKPAQTAAH